MGILGDNCDTEAALSSGRDIKKKLGFNKRNTVMKEFQLFITVSEMHFFLELKNFKIQNFKMRFFFNNSWHVKIENRYLIMMLLDCFRILK